MTMRQQTLAALDALGVAYTIDEHPAAKTIEDIDSYGLPHPEFIVKNLFVRDDKKRHYYLLVVRKDRRVNLRAMRSALSTRALSFASEEDLMRYLGLTRGAVGPLGVLNDTGRKVEVMVESALMDYPVWGVHPNDNTASVWLAPADMKRVIEHHGNAFRLFDPPVEEAAPAEAAV